ncbi:MAG: T9SS type A sorting domain-containing protein [Bacteroidetes bacterium]|nr:T9SS type A sorting domain-containing protein [Bacteroidota bacterium]
MRNTASRSHRPISLKVGNVHLIEGNYFGSSSYITEPTCVLDVPYSYQKFLDPVETLPATIPGLVRTDVEATPQLQPLQFSVEQNFPNPFNPSTIVRYQIPSKTHVEIAVYNIIGERVATLVDRIEEPGTHSIILNGEHFASGVYFISVRAGTYSTTKKAVLIK